MSRGGFYQEAIVGITDSVVLSGDPNRRSIVMQNSNTGGIIWIAFGRAANLTSSFAIMANVAPTYITYDMVGDVIRLDVHAIANAPNTGLAMLIGYDR